MRRNLKAKVLVPAFVVLLLAAAAAWVSAASAPVPFKGTLSGSETHTVHPPTMDVNGTATGNGTLLGTFTFRYKGTVNLTTSVSADLSAEFVAANGDTITATGHGQGKPTPTISYVTEWYTLTGGTGRFAGATGSFVVTRQVNRSTGAMSGGYDGSIVLGFGK